MLLAIALPIAAASQAAARRRAWSPIRSGRPLAERDRATDCSHHRRDHETRSDAGGSFKFAGVPAGDYLLSARLPGFRRRVNASSYRRRDDRFQ